jgi:heme/copper-type cytochrome/quinol oxidase subunit 4
MVTYHPISGEITYILAIVLTFSGLAALLARKVGNSDWTANRSKAAKNCHAAFAYFVIFVAQIAVSLGIYIYFDLLQEDGKGVTLIALNFGGFIVPLIVLECIH